MQQPAVSLAPVVVSVAAAQTAQQKISQLQTASMLAQATAGSSGLSSIQLENGQMTASVGGP